VGTSRKLYVGWRRGLPWWRTLLISCELGNYERGNLQMEHDWTCNLLASQANTRSVIEESVEATEEVGRESLVLF
jgi:hypothetical protein